MSSCVWWNPAPTAARKQTEPSPVGFSPAAVCRVIAALGTRNNESRLARLGRLRPVIVSQRPTRRTYAVLGRPAQLGLDPRQLLQALLERRVGRRQRLERDSADRRRDAERARGADLAQVALRDLVDASGDL